MARPGRAVLPGATDRGLSLLLIVAATTAACGATGTGVATVDPGDRAVGVVTTSCGDAGATEASGVVLADGRALTAAHVVAGAGSVAVVDGDRSRPATVAAYDTGRDLALLTYDPPAGGPGRDDALLRDAEAGEAVRVVDATTSGDVDLVVAERTLIEMDDVRSTGRSRRDGYRLEGSTAPGDSGAGLFDAEGRLVGLLFAASTVDDDRSWAVSATEIDAFLADPAARIEVRCDPAESKLVPVDP